MNIFFYNFFTWLHKTGMRLVSPWNSRAGLWLSGRKNIMERIKAALSTNNTLLTWMHCDSIGEFEQGLPLLEKIKIQYPGSKILITFFSPSGYEIKKNDNAADYIFYLPIDSKRNAQEFIDAVNPAFVLWVKCAFMFHYLDELKRRDIPVLLISGAFTDDQPFFSWYGKIHRYTLQCFTHLFVQEEASTRLLSAIGISGNVSISGDTRFDRVIEIAGQFEPIAIIEEFCNDNSPVIVAGSTWEEDEEELDHYANAHPEIKFIIAPHGIDAESLREVKKLFKQSIFLSELMEEKSKMKNPKSNLSLSAIGHPPTANVLIIDNIGMLSQLYKYATIAYIGGGFVDNGVHNVLEAAVYGKPVLFGPVIEQYTEVMELVDCGGGFVIDSALEVEETFNRLLTNPSEYFASCKAAKDYVYSRKGATEKIMEYIQEKRLLTN
jgi:3-deoxy-D-manno-octulosonic-acid transferase